MAGTFSVGTVSILAGTRELKADLKSIEFSLSSSLACCRAELAKWMSSHEFNSLQPAARLLLLLLVLVSFTIKSYLS